MSAPVRTYGGWRERRGFGLAGLSGPQTAVALGLVVTLLMAAMVRPSILLLLGAPLAGAAVLAATRVDGRSAATHLTARVRWSVGRRRGWDRHDGMSDPQLPAPLAGLRLLTAVDPVGREVGLIRHGRTRRLTGFIAVQPHGVVLVDRGEVESWQRTWGEWLAGLGHVPGLRHAAVTVVTGNSGGDAIDGDRVPAHRADTWVSVTVDAGTDRGAERLVDLLAGLAGGLVGCGVDVLDPVDPAAVVGWLRGGFEPVLDHRGAASGVWTDARPTAVRESWDCYRHDGWLSAAFCWDQCPGPGLGPHALMRLLGPSDYPKRVSVVFEPVPAHRAAREVERQTEAAVFRREYRRRIGRDETARDRVDLERARAAATDEAVGAGLVDVGLYAVVSAREDEDLPRIAADFEHRAGESHLRLRRAYGSQAAAFAAALGVGYVPGGPR
jgi:hypothetical protein